MRIQSRRTCLPDARIVAEHGAPLHVRIDTYDDGTRRCALGLEGRPGRINWTVVLTADTIARLQQLLDASAPTPTGH